MTDLWVFTGLACIAAAAGFVGRSGVRTSLLVGIGGPREDLGQARRLYRMILISAVAFTIAAAAAIVLGLRGAAIWRQTGEGQVVLNLLVVAAGLGLFRSFAALAYQQWSGKGSVPGVFRETIFSFLTAGLLMLALYFRWSA